MKFGYYDEVKDYSHSEGGVLQKTFLFIDNIHVVFLPEDDNTLFEFLGSDTINQLLYSCKLSWFGVLHQKGCSEAKKIKINIFETTGGRTSDQRGSTVPFNLKKRAGIMLRYITLWHHYASSIVTILFSSLNNIYS